MNFKYTAAETSGKLVEGTVEAKDGAEVLEWLASQNLRPLSIKAIESLAVKGARGIFSQPITVSDKVFLTKYLALMLKVGTDLFHAIDILISDFDKPAVKALLIEIRDNLSKGRPFYTTFAKYSKYFSSVFVNLIKAGEASGNLDKIFDNLSTSLEKEQDLRGKIRAALVYPIILLLAAFGILFLMVTVALPKIANTFLQGGIEPPAFSRAVFGIGLFVSKYVWIILPLMVLTVGGLWYFFSKTVPGKRAISRLLTRLPVVGVLVRRIAIQRFASTFSSLLRAGLPILEALEITADAVGSEELREALFRISREGVIKGLTVGEAFRREPYFPKVVTNLISISEKAGHMEDVLETLGDFYSSEIDSSVKTLVSFLEPVLLLGIGLIVAVIALSIITPIYQLTTAF
jgi:type IV pilus assembly protein PilC